MRDMPYSQEEWNEVEDKTTATEQLLWEIFGDYPPIEELRSRTAEEVEVLKSKEQTRELPLQRTRNALDDLDYRERQVIELRFGLLDGQPRTLVKVGEEMGCSERTVRRIEGRAFTKLRRVDTSRF